MGRVHGLQAAVIGASIRRRGVVLAVAALMGLICALVARNAVTDVFPEFAAKMVKVQTEAPGLSARQVELLVTDPLEAAASGLLGVQQVQSKSAAGISVLKIHFAENSALQEDRWRVAQRLSAVHLPTNAGVPRLTPMSSSTGTLLMAGLTSNRASLMQLNTAAQWQIRPRLLAVPGVADVLIFGGNARALEIAAHPQAMWRHKLGLQEVVSAARKATGLLGAGFVDTSEQRIVVQTSGLKPDADALGQSVLSADRQGVISLSDVARVAMRPQPAVGAASIGGQPGVLLVVNAQYGANTLEVTKAVQRTLQDLKPGLDAQGVDLHADLFRPADFIDLAIHNMGDSLMLGGLLVLGVILALLLDWRAALVSGLAIPLSLLAALAILVVSGISINVMSLGGLAIALGVVVDDAVIDVENILRRLRTNRMLDKPRPVPRVVLEACYEVRGAVVYATAAVLVVMVPVLMIPGLAGRLFSPMALAYGWAILASLAVALTVTPAAATFLLQARGHTAQAPAFVQGMQSLYLRLSKRIWPHWRLSMALCLALIAFAALALRGMGGSFLPPLQEGQFIVHMRLAPGASLESSLAMGARVGAALQALPQVRSIAQHVGRAALSPDASGTQSSEIDVNLKSGAASADALAGIRRVLSTFAGASFRVSSFFTERMDETVSGGTTAPLVVQVSGNHLRDIEAVSAEVAQIIAALPGATGVQVSTPPGVPQVSISLNPLALRQWGIAPLTVLQTVHTAFSGTEVGTVYRGSVPVPVRVELEQSARSDPAQLGQLMIATPAQGWVPLNQLASIQLRSGRAEIDHLGGQRVQQVVAATTSSDLAGFLAQAQQAVQAKVKLPPGVQIAYSGEATTRAQTIRQLAGYASAAAIALVVLLVAALRQGRQVALVLLSVPMAWAGGVLATWFVGGPMSMGAVIGLLALMGISLRNALLIFAHGQQVVHEERLVWNAQTVMRVVSDRLLPIVMTSAVTALGMLPIALGMHAPGREIEGPMAVTLLGGLLSGLLFNLLVLPQLALRYGAPVEPERNASGLASS